MQSEFQVMVREADLRSFLTAWSQCDPAPKLIQGQIQAWHHLIWPGLQTHRAAVMCLFCL